MFDIGFFELLLIGIVGLLVIGPKRLPEAIRTVGLLVGRLKRTLGTARQEFEKEFGVDEVRRQLHNEDVMRQLEETKNTIVNPNKPFVPSSNNQTQGNNQVTGNDQVSRNSQVADSPSDEKPNV